MIAYLSADFPGNIASSPLSVFNGEPPTSPRSDGANTPHMISGVKYLYQRGVIVYSSQHLYFIPDIIPDINYAGFISSYFSSLTKPSTNRLTILLNNLRWSQIFQNIIFLSTIIDISFVSLCMEEFQYASKV